MKIRTLFAITGAVAVLTGCLQDAAGPGQGKNNCTVRPQVAANITGDTVKATNGLKYFDVKVGTGATSQHGLQALVYYAGYLTNGTIFDASCEGGQGLQFAAGTGAIFGGGSLIPGFAQAVVGMKVGGVRRVVIPSELGYGNQPVKDNQGNVVIPANSTLVFDIELLNTQSQ